MDNTRKRQFGIHQNESCHDPKQPPRSELRKQLVGGSPSYTTSPTLALHKTNSITNSNPSHAQHVAQFNEKSTMFWIARNLLVFQTQPYWHIALFINTRIRIHSIHFFAVMVANTTESMAARTIGFRTNLAQLSISESLVVTIGRRGFRVKGR